MNEIKCTKYEEISKRMRELLLRSSAHGLPRLIQSKYSLIKLVWLGVLIISSTLGAYFIIKNIVNFLKYEATTTIRLIDQLEAEFPTVSFCSSNGFIMPLNQTILSLRFNNIHQSKYDQFFELFNDNLYGKCYRFNSGKNMFGENVPLLKSTQDGLSYGLKIEININVSNNTDLAELAVSIHNRSSPPFDFTYVDYYLSTGTWNYFEIQRVFYENLEQPYNDCIKDVREFELNKTIIDSILKSNLSYSKIDCFRMC